MTSTRDETYHYDVSRLQIVQATDEEKELLQKDLDVFFQPKVDPLDISKELLLQAEEELNENPLTLKDNIQALRNLIQAEPKLKGRVDDVYLCAFLRGKKHDIQEAFNCYISVYDFKKKYPDLYQYLSEDKFKPWADSTHFGSFPGIDKKGRKILTLRPGFIDLNLPIKDTFKMATGYTDLMLSDVYLQVKGMVIIMDLANMSIVHQAKMVTPTFAWHLTVLAQGKVPLRIKAVHIVNQPMYYSALYAIFKPFLKKKLRKRLHMHGNDWSSLHKHIAPEHLPAEYGGTRPPFKNHLTNSIMELNQHKLKEWQDFGYH